MSSVDEVVYICGKPWIKTSGTATGQTYTYEEIVANNGRKPITVGTGK